MSYLSDEHLSRDIKRENVLGNDYRKQVYEVLK